LRKKEIFNIAEVEYAMLEANGQLSILKKVPFQNIIKKDFNLPNSSQSLPVELVMDGKIIEKNTSGIYSREWIEAELKKRNIRIEEIYYAVVNSGGNLFVDKYEDRLSSPTDVE
jgi:uncharacterized membrane protein YcaP (DUF421 family)